METETFPSKGLMPVEVTQAETLRVKGDGRGVLVAVLDTGVDPLACGMQTTSHGDAKVVHLFDTSGSGDIQLFEKDLEVSRTIKLFSGRTLEVPLEWGDKVSIGIKNIFDLFPNALKKRVREEVQEQRDKWVNMEIVRIHKDKKEEDAKDLEACIGFVKDLCSKVSADTLFHDFVVFSSASGWRIASSLVDGKDTVDPLTMKLMRPYDISVHSDVPHLSTFSEMDMLTYSFNLLDDNSVLSLVTNAGAHGTHVAGIIGAFRDEGESGVAPGCQIVSFKIGDGRLGSMETNLSIVRALSMAQKLGCDIVNLSYGEPAFAAGGTVGQVIEQITEKGVLFVGSAGNAGPALCTVGAPAGLSGVFGVSVGAYVTTDMMDAEYAIRDRVPPTQFTWSSRGPAFDGARGVSVTAPGAAISPVPRFTLQKSQLMNGTSMSSPNVAGSIAVLISVLKAENLHYSPQSIKRAIENSSQLLEDVEVAAQGCGLIQMEECYHLISKVQSHKAQNAIYEIRTHFEQNKRGIFVTDITSHGFVVETNVEVVPRFPKHYGNIVKTEMELKIRLEGPSWVSHAQFLLLGYGGRTFDVRIDALGLSDGMHEGEILGIDSECPQAGPLFRVPICVIRPQSTVSLKVPKSIEFGPGVIHRQFTKIPAGATSAKFTVELETNEKRQFVLHCVYYQKEKSHRDTSFKKYFFAHPNETLELQMNVEEHCVMEIALAQFWKSIGSCKASIQCEFVGPICNSPILLSPSHCISSLFLKNTFKRQETTVSASLSQYHISAYPDEAVISSLSGERDIPPEFSPSHQLVLSYSFSLSSKTEITPQFLLLCSSLYESSFSSQFWMIFNTSKQHFASGDAFPQSLALEKGSYCIRYRIIHSDIGQLEKLKGYPLDIKCKLEKAVSLCLFREYENAVLETDSVSKLTLNRGESTTLMLRMDTSKVISGLPKKVAKEGTVVSGEVVLKSGKCKHSVNIWVYNVKAIDSSKVKKEKGFESSIAQWLDTLKSDEFEQAFEKYAKPWLDSPSSLPLLCAQLNHFNSVREKDEGALNQVVSISGMILSRIDAKSVASALGVKETEENEKEREVAKKEKDILIDTLEKRIHALFSLNSNPDEDIKQLEQWVDISKEAKYVKIYTRKCKSKDPPLLGKCVQNAMEIIKSDPSVPQSVWTCIEDGIEDEYMRTQVRMHQLLCYPDHYPLF